jgi:hypothetical protein
MDVSDQIIDLIYSGVNRHQAATVVVQAMDIDQLRADRIAQETLRIRKRLDKRVRDDSLNENEQLLLPIIGQQLPHLIRHTVNGDVEYTPWQYVTDRGAIAEHWDWLVGSISRELGIAKRQQVRFQTHLYTSDWPDGVPLGRWMFGDRACAICQLPWREGDPFEEAHREHLAGMTEELEVDWVHRSCNRSEGVR